MMLNRDIEARIALHSVRHTGWHPYILQMQHAIGPKSLTGGKKDTCRRMVCCSQQGDALISIHKQSVPL